jgi:hypothetical protein
MTITTTITQSHFGRDTGIGRRIETRGALN